VGVGAGVGVGTGVGGGGGGVRRGDGLPGISPAGVAWRRVPEQVQGGELFGESATTQHAPRYYGHTLSPLVWPGPAWPSLARLGPPGLFVACLALAAKLGAHS
jgi:hypothetical protein